MTDVWKGKVQQFHAGQEWRSIKRFVEDYGVTCNGLGTPEGAMKAAKDAVDTIEHYPAADFEPAITDLADFVFQGESSTWRPQLLLGNGASELIDLVTRLAPRGPWRPGPTLTQYKEYERAATADDRKVISASDETKAAVTAIVNPTNPTGDFLDIEDMKKYIENLAPRLVHGAHVLVDESMIMWHGPDWREHSLHSQGEWIRNLSRTKDIHVWVMTSWTKIWACPGIRIGSVFAPTVELHDRLQSKQVPWSLNSAALAFISAVVRDEEYMRDTWELTTSWRKDAEDRIKRLFPHFKIYGKKWLSWLWIDTGNEMDASAIVSASKAAGMPIRAARHGYNLPTFIRIAARSPELNTQLMAAWQTVALSHRSEKK